eukprot:gene17618-19372_t
MAAEKLLEKETELKARLLSNVNPVSLKDEALACLDYDVKKSTFLYCKAGQGFLQSKQSKEANLCLIKAIDLATASLKQCTLLNRGNNVEASQNGFDSNSINNNQVSYDSNECCLERGAVQRRSRLKRQKMEQISKLSKSMRHGSADLFQTMVQCYEESFDIKQLDNDAERKLAGNKKVINRTEILLNRDLVLKELADTEKSYVESLEYVAKNILPIFENSPSETLKEAIPGIFCNIKDIYEWHSRGFVDKIEDCLEDHELLGPTFQQHQDELCGFYETYCQNKPQADDLLVDLAEDIDQVYQQLDTNYSIMDYLIKPVQRVMKYQLLLHSIKKYTKKLGEDMTSIQTAFDVMEIVPQKVNDKMHLAMIIGYPGDLGNLKLVFQDTLDVVVGRGKSKPKKYRIFIFEKVVLITETLERIGRLPKYRCIYEGRIHRMGLTETVENDKLKFAIWFRKLKTSDIFVCTAETKQLKERWIKIIADVLGQNGGGAASSGTIRAKSESSYSDSKSKWSSKSKTWSPAQFVKQATIGHPREYAMSTKLKENIEKYLLEELTIMAEDEDKDEDKDEFMNIDDQYEEDCFIDKKITDGSTRDSESSPNSSTNEECIEENDDSDNRVNSSNASSPDEEDDNNNTYFMKLHRSYSNPRNKTLKIDQKIGHSHKSNGETQKNGRLQQDIETLKQTNGKLQASSDRRCSCGHPEVHLLKRILAEAHYNLAQSKADISIKEATELYDKSLSLFFNVEELKSLECIYKDREDLFQKCIVLYQDLKSTESFGTLESEFSDWESFYGFNGLFNLLLNYADLSSNDVSSSWCIVLYSLAVMAASIESQHENAGTIFRKLGELYKLHGSLDNSAESFIDAHYLHLDSGHIEAAIIDLVDALKIALLSGDLTLCKKFETMTMPLMRSNKESSLQDCRCESLQFMAEMSCARRNYDYAWFTRNYSQICTCERNCLETVPAARELNKLFMHLLDEVIKKKQRKSGEVFV